MIANRRIEQEELNELVRKHNLWLDCEDGGERLVLQFCNLSGSDLCNSRLMCSDFRGSDLRCSNLRCSNFRGSDLRCSNLSGSDLRCSNLRCSDLRGSDLSSSNLSGSDLRGSSLSGIIANTTTSGYWPVCPTSGSFIGWKKCRGFVVKLFIPASAQRSSATTRKCRCSKAKVLDILRKDGITAGIMSIASEHDQSFLYEIGKTSSVPSFDPDRWNECSTGIHFFMTFEEAVQWNS